MFEASYVSSCAARSNSDSSATTLLMMDAAAENWACSGHVTHAETAHWYVDPCATRCEEESGEKAAAKPESAYCGVKPVQKPVRRFSTAARTVAATLEELVSTMSSQDCVDNRCSVSAAGFVEWLAEDRVLGVLQTIIDTPKMQMEALSILLDACLVQTCLSTTDPWDKGSRADTHMPILLFLLKKGIIEQSVLRTWTRVLKSLSAKNQLCINGLDKVINKCGNLVDSKPPCRAPPPLPQHSAPKPYPRYVRIPPRRMSHSSPAQATPSQETSTHAVPQPQILNLPVSVTSTSWFSWIRRSIVSLNA
ncbi:hypothetical protein BJ741DRAFT_603218 [Chytriomyces cf. hyalinus JEL632]|nr:hypothetical protein BJ741DRAFT_603218 [Chytriomyces cf. hyalinus JEL632]